MFRVTLGLATATFIALAASPASAGCCGSNVGWGGGWNAGWGVNNWGGGCCNSGYAYAQPQYHMQPIVVQAPPQQIIVQQSQPEVIFQQAAFAPVPSYNVDHGPYYAGPQTIGYPRTQYYGDEPVRPYPYVSGGGYYRGGYGRPYYRGWRGAGYRGYRGYGIYRGGYSRRYAGYHGGARYYRGGVVPRAHVGVRRNWR